MAQTSGSIHEIHKQKWYEMQGSLSTFCSSLQASLDDFRQKFKQNWEMGFPSENAYYYQQAYLSVVEQEIDELIQTIHGEHFDFIDGKINMIDELLKVK